MWIKLLPKTIGNRKRDCAWGCAWGINTTREKKHKSVRWAERTLPDLCFSICRFSQVVFIPQAQPHAQSLFLFPIVFGNNLIHFFDFFPRERKTVQPKIRSFALLLRSPVNHAIWQCEECEPFRKMQRSWKRKVWTQRHSRGEKLRCKFFWQGKRKTRRQY